MNKQRFAVIIVALIGLIATFLPWYKIVHRAGLPLSCLS